MSISERKNRDKEIIKEKIVNTATELFSLYGYEHVSMRKIAEKIEYSPTTIYNYFKNKNELLFVLLKHGYKLFYHSLDTARKDNEKENFDRKLKEVFRAYIEFGLANKDYYKLMFMMNIDSDDSLMGCENEKAKAFSILMSLAGEGNKHHYFINSNEMLVSQIIWGQLHGITSLLISYQNFSWIPNEVLIGNYMESILIGLKK
ncbi:TetR/AcrR family transcriptional regulator [Cytobacillus kochii]|uniref:TetR/AcrR family transcriptional regulator n=1 Tax=Cytobacillus kochii TaxID=859143 RepID=UPI0020422ECA|nr:TetR/AcrR family transcriptional regulator [Cytobacillus kochii]MCM3320960.1 TetR/AcrR family transcriptional regulator [Cytobacillus kochii]MCM3344207.1 TetR/AcrR family transcriptional regulator [Cytobacillus kochii]